eukprot:gene11201-12376_t
MATLLCRKCICRNFKSKLQPSTFYFTHAKQGDKLKRGFLIERIFTRKFNGSPGDIPNNRTSRIIKPLLFTGLFGCGAFAACTILQYERIRHAMISRGYRKEGYERSRKELSFRSTINSWWNSLNDGQKLASGIIALNACVFVCWQIPAMRYFMTKWFTANAFSRRSLPMFTSTFSHSELWHLGCNMVVLWSFALPIQDLLGSEQFLAFYLTGGVVASLCSHALKIATGSAVASLGASGALLAVLGAVCIERPDARLAILFLPFFSFSAKTALMSIIAIDVAGLLFRWRLFDHGAHLGGTLFGIWYVKYGHNLIWENRTPLLHWWHNLREGKKGKV